MSTRDIVLGIKKGDRVVYVANNGVEYNAVALDIAHFGYNQAVRASGAFLNLAYFDELGTPVKISAATLLGSEADDEHFGAAAYDAAKRDVRYHGSTGEDKEALVTEHFDRLKATPRTIGWRAGSVEDKVYVPADPASFDSVNAAAALYTQKHGTFAPIPAAPSELELSYEETQPDLDEASAKSKLEAMAAEGNGGAAVTLDAHPSSEDLDAVAEDPSLAPNIETREYADGSSATGVAPLPELSPAEQEALTSAADPNAVAAEPATVDQFDAEDAAREDSRAESLDDSPAEPTADDPAAQNDSASSAA